jgi:hypothetical protein
MFISLIQHGHWPHHTSQKLLLATSQWRICFTLSAKQGRKWLEIIQAILMWAFIKVKGL